MVRTLTGQWGSLSTMLSMKTLGSDCMRRGARRVIVLSAQTFIGETPSQQHTLRSEVLFLLLKIGQ